ncbi:MAG: fatty acid desaturase [Deltaproteobacteria bacterium]|nr:fatty acid desaturase [Deltaproteobacteria bacterium]MBW2444626.1 fatty acid desaturase [Deltaproteobacteria bacterium]
MTTADLEIASNPRDQKKLEQRIAAKYRGDFSFRLVLATVAQLAAWVGVIALAMNGVLPYAVACLANGWIAYLMYMTLHGATHGNVSGRHAKLRWADDLVGSVSAIPLWFSYRSHRISHMKHHAFTNDPKRDPDFFVAGSFWQLFPKIGLIIVLRTVIPILTLFPNGVDLLPASLRRLRGEEAAVLDPLEARYSQRFERLCLALFLGLSLAGFFWEALWLWFVPSRIGFFLIAAIFAWLPHHPHNERGRYRDTRVTLFPGGTFLLRGQNHHILHHMFPRVPHYRLPTLFREMRPILEAHDVRIEGPLAGPDTPPILLRWDESMKGGAGA